MAGPDELTTTPIHLGGVAAENDAVYVTDGLFFGGRLLRIRG